MKISSNMIPPKYVVDPSTNPDDILDGYDVAGSEDVCPALNAKIPEKVALDTEDGRIPLTSSPNQDTTKKSNCENVNDIHMLLTSDEDSGGRRRKSRRKRRRHRSESSFSSYSDEYEEVR